MNVCRGIKCCRPTTKKVCRIGGAYFDTDNQPSKVAQYLQFVYNSCSGQSPKMENLVWWLMGQIYIGLSLEIQPIIIKMLQQQSNTC